MPPLRSARRHLPDRLGTDRAPKAPAVAMWMRGLVSPEPHPIVLAFPRESRAPRCGCSSTIRWVGRRTAVRRSTRQGDGITKRRDGFASKVPRPSRHGHRRVQTSRGLGLRRRIQLSARREALASGADRNPPGRAAYVSLRATLSRDAPNMYGIRVPARARQWRGRTGRRVNRRPATASHSLQKNPVSLTDISDFCTR